MVSWRLNVRMWSVGGSEPEVVVFTQAVLSDVACHLQSCTYQYSFQMFLDFWNKLARLSSGIKKQKFDQILTLFSIPQMPLMAPQSNLFSNVFYGASTFLLSEDWESYEIALFQIFNVCSAIS